jgi:hypothetical protein
MVEFWRSSLAETLTATNRLSNSRTRSRDFGEWLGYYSDAAPTSSNQGSDELPFQRWFHFKEAFSPKFVADTLGSLPYKIKNCLDPFGGSGTTGLTCRMLGISSTSIEVNPFLADLIQSKLSPVAPADFCAAYERLITGLEVTAADVKLPSGMPPTITEPGLNNRYIFPADVFATARAILRASASLEIDQARLLKIPWRVDSG